MLSLNWKTACNLNFLLVQNSGDTPPGSNKPDRLISSHGHLDQEMTTTTSLIGASGQQQVATGGKMGGPGLATNSVLFCLGLVKIKIIVLPVGQIMQRESLGKDGSYLPATSFCWSPTLERHFEQTRCPSRGP